MGYLDGGFMYSPDVPPLPPTGGMFRKKHKKEPSLILSL
jgi:hypothetical protein